MCAKFSVRTAPFLIVEKGRLSRGSRVRSGKGRWRMALKSKFLSAHARCQQGLGARGDSQKKRRPSERGPFLWEYLSKGHSKVTCNDGGRN